MIWQRVSGPREFDKHRGFDMDVGWAWTIERNWTIERDGAQRTISVIVAGGLFGSGDLPDDCRRALATRGRSAVDATLGLDEPPRYILVTTGGLQERAE
jgi:hypothetical protein